MTDTLREREAVITEARKAISYLYLEVPGTVARNVAGKIEALISLLWDRRTPEQEAMERDRLESKIRFLLAAFFAEAAERPYVVVGPQERKWAGLIMDAILQAEEPDHE